MLNTLWVNRNRGMEYLPTLMLVALTLRLEGYEGEEIEKYF